LFELVFFTSNRVKTQHARYLCRDYDIRIENFNEKTKRANYEEPQIDNRDELLKISFENAKRLADETGIAKFGAFIIEDTSVNIHALTMKYGKEFPGVNIKYWMMDTSFEDIDFEISMLGNNRNVTVRSDLILYLPSLSKKPIYFFSESHGQVTSKYSHFDTNAVYPWLDNKTFNKWFQPNGENEVISKLPIEKANLYDFRASAFSEMLSLLYKNKIIKKNAALFKSAESSELFGTPFNCHIIVGLTCAGKTTIANYLVDIINCLHVEASDFMHEIYRENHGLDSDVSVGNFAKQLLKEKPTAVAERVVGYISSFKLQNIVITGYRLEHEVAFTEEHLASSIKAQRVIIEAERDIRELRRKARNRNEDRKSDESLINRDRRELDMGMDSLVSNSLSTRVDNNQSFEEFYDLYSQKLVVLAKLPNPNVKVKRADDFRLSDLIILALYTAWTQGEKSSYFSTTDICKMVNNLGLSKPKFINNVGRYFSKHINALFEVTIVSRGRKYRLSNTGAGYAKVLLRDFSYKV
jgi:inosine/xanthosine triphosphate pyrophosphatase family protein/adenylate kinase family enzyme